MKLNWSVIILLLLGGCQVKKSHVLEDSIPEKEMADAFLEEDLQIAACELFNKGLLAIHEGDPELGLTCFDQATEIMYSWRLPEDSSVSFQKAFQELMEQVQLEEFLVFQDQELFADTEENETILDQLSQGELSEGIEQEMVPEYEHFFFDDWEMGNPRTAELLQGFTNQYAQSIQASLERSRRYLPMIKKVFEEECLPEDLSYLPIIESGYKSSIRSRAKAVGLWQFMQGTAKMMGLKVDWWIDERRDPEKATRAAAKYLNFLYEQYNDWYLTLVAYNAGPGRVNRAIRKGKTRDFWTLVKKRLLPRESRNYIPSFMAAVTIARNPEAFGFENLDYLTPIESDVVEVPFSLELSRLARELGIDARLLYELNPSLRRRITPGGNPPFRLKVPKGLHQKTLVCLDQIPENERLEWKQYRIRKGDTLGRISRKYGVSIYALETANQIRNPKRLKIGQILLIPLGPEEQVVPLVRTEMTSYSYRIQRGDTLSSVAKRYGVSLKSILSYNPGIQPKRLRPGKTIYLKKDSASGEWSRNSQGSSSWVVHRGDTLYDIARKRRTTIATLCELNNISPHTTLFPGQKLDLPEISSSKTHYAIRKGDTLSKIAKKFNVKLRDLLVWNQLSKDHILQIGQNLVVYQ